MRVITGTARGRVLRTLEGEDVRPTTDRVKESVFSIIQFEIEGRRVLDLFAGSGQLGIEALSRGADSATFVDMSKDSLATVKYNLEHTKLGDRALQLSVFCTDKRHFFFGKYGNANVGVHHFICCHNIFLLVLSLTFYVHHNTLQY